MSRSSAKLVRRAVDPLHLTHPEFVLGRDGRVLTLGPVVADLCAAQAGFVPDPEQELILDLIFAYGPDGKSAAFEIDVIAARQNLKTGLILMAEIGWLFVSEEELIVHSAHELDTTAEAFIDLRNLITNTPAFSRKLAAGPTNGIYEGNGQWRIELASGQRLKYKARTKGGGRGLTGNKVVLDEGFALQPSHMGALLPTLAAVPDPQVLTASSAGKLESAVLRDKRDRGRAKVSPRQVYVEYGDPHPHTGCVLEDCTHAKDVEGCALDDEARWEVTNPALGRRITLDTLRSMRQAMPPEEFAREFLVWWEDPVGDAEAAIDLAKWPKLANLAAKRPPRVKVFIACSPDGQRTTIATAGQGSRGRTLVMVKTRPGRGWVVKQLRKMLDRGEVVDVALNSRTQAGPIAAKLAAADIDFEDASGTEASLATMSMIRAVEDGEVEHVGQPELDAAVAAARTRRIDEGERFDQRDPAGPDISPLIAAAGARHRWAVEGDYDIEDSYL